MQDRKYKESDLVKVRLKTGKNTEKVWAEVWDLLDKKTLRLRIDNKPVITDFELGEEVDVPESYILDKWKEQ